MRATVFTVATGLYLDYWKQLVADSELLLFPDADLQFVVFTDRANEALEFAHQRSRAAIDVVPTSQLRWPEATMLRYSLIAEAKELVRGDILMHLDADMRLVAEVGPEMTPDVWRGGLALVRHPGFYRGVSYPAFAMAHPKVLLPDVKRLLSGERGIGQWERRPQSRAYVPPRLRQTYVCGGVWFGRRVELLSMARVLARRTQEDQQLGLVARWHDESHLNWFAANHEVTLLDPSYCYGQGLAGLGSFSPKIVAVEKGEARVRTAVVD